MINIEKQKKIKNICNRKQECPCKKCNYSMNKIQNAIANIIYAQGEQIKKIISMTEDKSYITNINYLINKNIYQLTIFENSLYDNFKLCYYAEDININPTCNCDIDGGVF